MKISRILSLLPLFLLMVAISCQTDTTPLPKSEIASTPSFGGIPTLAEFGRGTCIPCKEMKPILEELALEYKDKLRVLIISVDEYRNLTNFYKIMAIPTQICFDSDGNEIFRHVGFWPKQQIIAELNKMGIK